MGVFNFDCTKRGSSSKPTYLQQQTKVAMGRVCSAKNVMILWWFSLIGIGTILYYSYLLKLYILDDSYDVRGPKELLISEKMTIRVVEPLNIQDLNKFVLHYSICPVVHEIQIIWHSTNKEPPRVDAFKYTTTHGKVSFHKLGQNYYESYIDPSTSQTDAVMLLDVDVFITCVDLKFAQTVWSSSYDGQVGLFPRVAARQAESNEFEYQNPSSIFFQGKYSILLSSALLTGKHHLESLKKSSEMKEMLQQHPTCYDLLPSIWISKQSQMPPIWIDIGYDVEHDAKVASFPQQSEKGFYKIALKDPVRNKDVRTSCLNLLAKSLNLEVLPYSTVKATRASSHWTW